MALGLTQQLPIDEKHNYSREYLEDQIAILLGGRIAEEITIGSITTGAGNDLERATDLARRMVCEWGMSDAMGPLTFGKKEEQIFLGREIAQHQDYSEDTALRIDQEVKRFVTDNYARAQAILTEHKQKLLDMADALLARETLDAEQVRRIWPPACRSTSRRRPPGRTPPPARDAKPAKERPAHRDRAAAAAAAGHAGIGSSQVQSSRGQKAGQRSSAVTYAAYFCTLTFALSDLISSPVHPRRRFTVPLPGGRTLDARRAHARHGHHQRHARLVLRRRRAARSAARRSRPACGWSTDGADLLDVGGESTRPGAQPLDEAEERRRVLPVIEGLAARVHVPISIDTYKAAIADAALAAGASIVNDISGLRYEPRPGRRRGAARRADHPDAHARAVARHVPAGRLSRRRRRGARRAAREHRVRRRRRHARTSHARRSRARLRQGRRAQLRGAGAARRVRRARPARRRRAVAQVVPDAAARAATSPPPSATGRPPPR